MTTSRPHYRLTLTCATTFIILGIAAAPSYGESDSIEAKFERLNKVALSTRDLTADYVEEKFSVMLTKPMVSTGRVFVKSDRTRWHTTSPHDSTLFTNQSEIAIYFPARKVMEVYAVDRKLRALTVSPVPQIAAIQEQFTIEIMETSESNNTQSENTLNLRLTPIGQSLSEYIEEVRVAIDMKVGLATRVEMIDPTGDRTVVTFTNIRTNIGLKERDVARNVPADTKIIRPMESMEPEKNRNASIGSDKP